MTSTAVVPVRRTSSFKPIKGSSMPGQGWRFRAWHALAIALALACAFCGLVAATLLEARRDNWDRTSQSARNLAHAMAEEIQRTIESLDLSLRGVVDNSQIPEIMRLAPSLRDMVLFDRAATAKNLGFLALLNADGNVAASARLEAFGPLILRLAATSWHNETIPGLAWLSAIRFGMALAVRPVSRSAAGCPMIAAPSTAR